MEGLQMRRIYVLDDEKNIRELIGKYLKKEGYEAQLFESGEEILRAIESQMPDLAVLDIMMHGIDGLEVCREIRKKSDIPIIFVSAKNEEFDRVLGLELGADDYLSKPFSPRELLVRIKNILRRIEKSSSKAEEEKSDIEQIKDLTIDYGKRYVEANGNEMTLTKKEYDLVEFLIRNKNMPFKREDLIEKIWGYDYLGDLRVIDDLVKRIRKKLSENGAELEITTVWGFGYKIDER